MQDKIKQADETRHKKYVRLEALSEFEFGIKFHKFYSDELKQRIQKVGSAKFRVENRSWVMSLPDYYKLLEQIRSICTEFGIHIQEIPHFVVNLVLYKTPCTGEHNQFGAYNYNNDAYEVAEVAKCFPKSIYESLSA